MSPSIDHIIGRTQKPSSLPKRVISSREEVLKNSALLAKKLVEMKATQKKYDPIKLGNEKRYLLQQEIIRRLTLNPTERQILLEYSALDRQIGEIYRQSLKRENTGWSNSIDVLNKAKQRIGGLNKSGMTEAKVDKFKLQQEIEEVIGKFLKDPKKTFVPLELIAKMKRALVAITNQRVGYDIHKEIVEMSKRIEQP